MTSCSEYECDGYNCGIQKVAFELFNGVNVVNKAATRGYADIVDGRIGKNDVDNDLSSKHRISTTSKPMQ